MIIFFLSRDYLFTLIKTSKYFILSCYYHICLLQTIWNSSAHRKHTPGRRDIVCAQARLSWVAVGPVSTPLLRILEPSTAGGNPVHFNHKRPTTLNWRLRWRVEKQIGTGALTNKCLQNPEQREIWMMCPRKQSPSQRRLTNSSLTRQKVTTEWGLDPSHDQESLLTMPTSLLKFYSPCNTHSNKWWKKSVSWKQTKQRKKEASMTQNMRQTKKRHQQEVSHRMRNNVSLLWPK